MQKRVFARMQKAFARRKQGKGGKLLGAPSLHADFLRETAENCGIWQREGERGGRGGDRKQGQK